MIRSTAKAFCACSAIAILLLASGCAGSTKFVSSWKDPSVTQGSVKKVFVVGVARDMAIRHTFEDSFKKELAGSKTEATPSYEWFPELDLTKIDKDAAAARLRDQGFTHVIVSRLVDKKTVDTYVPPSAVSVGVGYGGYGGYPGYYGGWYPYMSTTYVSSPGYVQSNEVYSVETNLYDLSKKEGVAWSGLTQTTLSGGQQGDIADFVKTIVWEMKSKQVL